MFKIGIAAFRLIFAAVLLYFAVLLVALAPTFTGRMLAAFWGAYGVLTLVSTFAARDGAGSKFTYAEALAMVIGLTLMTVEYLPRHQTDDILLVFCGWVAALVLNFLAFRILNNSTT